MDEAALKAQLAVWSSGGGGPVDVPVFVSEHLDTLGSLDPELRDELFYETLTDWIDQGCLSTDQLLQLARRLTSETFLFRGIGEPYGVDVFRRTFSSLILDAIVQRLNATDGMDFPESIAEAAERYAREELDLRGFVESCGWAHAPAHAADLLASLAASPRLPEVWIPRILAAVGVWLHKSPSVYTHQEDKRLARVVRTLCERRGAEVQPWLEDLVEGFPVSFRDMAIYARRTNLLDFLRALFFHLRVIPGQEALASFVEGHVRALMRIA